MRKTIAGVLLLSAMLGAACGDSPSGPEAGPRLVSVLPAPNAVGVDPATDLVLEFSASMIAGEERQVSVMRAGRTDALGMHGEWANDGRTLRMRPDMPFEPGTQYVMHVGAMHDRQHRELMAHDGTPMNGMGGMDPMGDHADHNHDGGMGGHHGMVEHEMDADSCTARHDAMMFVFTTAD